MLNFLKKKSNEPATDISMDQLPEPPKPVAAQSNKNINTQASDSVMQAPPPPKTKSFPFPSIKTEPKKELSTPFGPVSKENDDLEPLPDAPMIPVEKLSKLDDSFSVDEPSKLPKNKEIISPKDIDPRDRFDDLLKIENTPELESPESMSEKPQVKPVPTKKIVEEDVPPEIVDHLPFEREYELPSAEELAEVLAPVLKKSTPSVVPRSLPAFDSGLPSFEQERHQVVNPASMSSMNSSFDLPNINMVPPKEKDLVIYVSVNDYAKVTQTMKTLLNFFSTSGKLLGNADNPEKIHVLNDLFKELNVAQQNLMKIDKKLFEGDYYGA